MRRLSTSLLLAAIIGGLIPFNGAQAAPSNFSMNFIVSDDEFTDTFALSANSIQEFLNTQSGILKSYVHSDGRTAAKIIFDAGQTYNISPKVLLTSIQKESSMITRTNFPNGQQYYLDWVMFYGWCDSCSTGSNKGFANQVTAAAAAFRRYLDQIADPNRGYTVSGWGPGLTKNLQCISSDWNNGRELCTPGATISITPSNGSTAALYTYTPHPGGNYAFWYLWNLFGFQNRRIYPDGSLLRSSGSPNIWLIQGGKKRRFTNSAAFMSRYSFGKVITVPSDHLFAYDTGAEINFANFSLLSNPKGGVYLLANETKRPIVSRAAFQKAGFLKEEVVKASWAQLNQYPDGEPITENNIFPSGQLVQNKSTGAIFFLKDGIRHPIVSGAIYKSQYGLQRPQGMTPATLEKYAVGDPIGFKEGELVVSEKGGTVYVISNGQRLPIANSATFTAYRFNWRNIIRVPDKALNVHGIGQTLDVNNPIQTASQ